ncbi:phosphate/phosphite/phosphonate ABC transporter substrate-binding protein [Sulfurospirillum oryzae]|uniref:phosphate/phosphite/phosphonate ABC transporter substrate-binding protein n=1 Tax=Sulfurospirillum oryzae TaxID=2976535 RepID=UPI0021E75F40|nr:phosphate/phosphite/phosphonate ABC transporter substrate-binding protein [Sulfurospirillum oryzae]
MKTVLYAFLSVILLFSKCEIFAKEALYRPTSKEIASNIYIVGIHPYINTQQMFLSYRPILDYLEKNIPNTLFVLETSENYAQYNQKLQARVFDFSLPNPYQTVTSFNYGYHVIAKMKPDSAFKGIFVARKSSHLRTFEQLKNQKISFPAPTALAAAMMPLYFLKTHGLDIDKDIKKVYVGSQFSSIMNAYSGDTIVGATWPTSYEDWCKQNAQKAQEMEVVWETEILVNNGFIVHERVPLFLAERIAILLATLDTHNEGKKLLHDAGFSGFELASNETYDKVVQFLEQYDKEIGLPK